MKKFFKNCAMFIALAAMSLSLNAAAPGDDLTSSFANANFANGTEGWTVTAKTPDKITFSVGQAGEYGFTSTFLKATSEKAFHKLSVSQVADSLPLGDYEVSGICFREQNTARYDQGELGLTANGTYVKAGKSSAAGGAKVVINARVSDGKLTLAFTHADRGNNHILGYGDLKVVYKGAPSLEAIVAISDSLSALKFDAALKADLDKVIADAKSHGFVTVDSAYMALYSSLETLNGKVPTSVKSYEDYAKAIATAKERIATSSFDATEINAIVAEHEAVYAAGTMTSTSIAELEEAVMLFDASFYINNPSFTDGLNGWTLDTIAKNAKSPIVVEFIDTLGVKKALFLHNTLNEKQAFNKLELSQTVTGLPNGDYFVSVQVQRREDTNYEKDVHLWANDKSAKANKGAKDRLETIKTKVRVTDGTLAIKLVGQAGKSGHYIIDNFALQYVGFESWAKIDGNTATASSIEELIDALKDERLAGQDAVINLTAAGPYNVGNNYQKYAAFKSLTIKSTAGAKIQGTITANPTKLDFLTLEGITFYTDSANAVQGNQAWTPIYFKNAADSIGVVTVKNCTFDKITGGYLIGHRGGKDALIGTLNFTGNTINDRGFYKADGGEHTFAINSGAIQNINMTENVFNNYAGKHFMQFANIYAAPKTDSIINITVENNVFNGWGNRADATGNGHNFVEFEAKENRMKGLNLNINNNIFYHNIVDTLDANRVPTDIELKNASDDFLKNTVINVQNNLLIPDSVVSKRVVNPSYEDVIAFPTSQKEAAEAGKFKSIVRENYFQKDFPEFVYDASKKMLQTNPMYTAGKDGKYIGIAAMYYDFAASEVGATVSTAAGLTQAIAYDFPGIENPVITLLDCTDEGGIYVMETKISKAAGAYKSLTIKAAAGAKPVVIGTLSTKYNLESLTIDGLTFAATPDGNGGYANDFAPIMMMNNNDSIGTLTIKNSTYKLSGKNQIFLTKNPGYVGKFIFTNNVVANYGTDGSEADGGNHPFQFNKNTFTIGSLEFTENQFIEYGGKQFINFSNVGPVAGSDSIMHINFSNNTLYGFGGTRWIVKDGDTIPSYSNFIEFTKGKDQKWVGADININNNLFYELNHSYNKGGIPNRLALGTNGTNETYKVNVLNNVFYPDTMMVQVELGKTMESCNLPIYDNAELKATRNDLTLAALGLTPETIWFKGEALAIPHTSPLMKAGVDGTYIGAKANYVKDTEGIPTVAYITTDQVMAEGAAATTNDPIYNYLNEGYDFNMVLVVVSDDKKADISAAIDLTKYDAAIIAEQFAGDAAALMPDGPLAINKLTIPTIYNKTYALRGDRALAGGQKYGGGADANVASIVVAKENQTWGVFDGIDFTKGDTIVIFKELSTDNGELGVEGDKGSVKGINYVKGLDMLLAGKLADPAIADVSAVSACINYVATGTTLAEGVKTVAPMFIFGMNSGAICANNGENITEDGLKLWKNALNTLLGEIDETPRNLVGLKKVAYVTAEKAMAEGCEDAILAALSADESLNVVKMFATDVNIEGFDAAIVQESLGGKDAVLKPEGALGLANLSVPTIYNKAYALQDGRAFTSVGKAAAGKEAGETVLTITKTKESSLFEGVFAEGAKEAQMFVGTASDTGAEGTKALNYAAGVENAGTQLATPTGVEAAVAINYIKAGEVLGDATLKTNVLTMGMNYGALNVPGNVTEANIKLWKNAVAIMIGAKELTIEDLPNALNAPVVLNKVFANNGVVYVNAAEAAVINVYSMTGSLVKSVEVKEGLNSINGLSAGQVYMIRCNDEVSKVIL